MTTNYQHPRVAKFMGASALALLLAGGPSPAEANDYYVDAVTGSDVTGDGTAANPWKSITHSIESIDGGELWVAKGIYDEANGERFPVQLVKGYWFFKTMISLHGSTVGNTTIRGGLQLSCDTYGFSRPGIIQHLYLEASPTDYRVGINDRCGGVQARDNVIDGFQFGHRVEYPSSEAPVPDFIISDSHLSNNVYRNNEVALEFGVGLAVKPRSYYEDRSVIENNLFVDNGTAILVLPRGVEDLGSTLLYTEIRNNTIVGSTTYAIHVDSYDLPEVLNAPTIVNNIIAFGSGYGIYDPVAISGDPAVIDFNTFYDNALGDMLRGVNAGANNQFADPRFVGLVGGDLHLAAGSPCIDGGSNPDAPSVDLAYAPRPVDGDGDTVTTTDIGCYEMPRRLAGVNLRRADFVDAVAPAKAAAFPFDASNPRTPVVVVEFVSGDADPTPGILDDPTVPLAFYQLEPSPGRVVYAVKDAAGGTVRFATR